MPTHQPESSCLAGAPCAAGTSGNPSGPLSGPLWAAPPDPPQALHLALTQAAFGAVEGHAEGPADRQERHGLYTYSIIHETLHDMSNVMCIRKIYDTLFVL